MPAQNYTDSATMFYATLDSSGGRIARNADILAFESIEEAYAFLLGPCVERGYDLSTARIVPGRFGEGWIEVDSEPKLRDGKLVADCCGFAPFAADQLYIAGTGQCSGCHIWRVEPIVDVLVLASVLASASRVSRPAIAA